MAEEAGAVLRNGAQDRHQEMLEAEVQALMTSVPSVPRNDVTSVPQNSPPPCPPHSEENARQQSSDLVGVDCSSSSLPQPNTRKADLEDLDSFSLIEPPPLDWRSDSSSEAGGLAEVDRESFLQADLIDTPEYTPSEDGSQLATSIPEAPLLPYQVDYRSQDVGRAFERGEEEEGSQDEVLKGQQEKHEEEEEELQHQQQEEKSKEVEEDKAKEQCVQHDVDHSRIHTLLSHLQLLSSSPSPAPGSPSPSPTHTLVDLCDSRGGAPYGESIGGADYDDSRGGAPYGESIGGAPYDDSRGGAPCDDSRGSAPYGESRGGAPYNDSRGSAHYGESRGGAPNDDSRGGVPFDPLPSLGPADMLQAQDTDASGLLFTESHQRDLLGLLEGPSSPQRRPPRLSPPHLSYGHLSAGVDAVVSVSYSPEDAERYWERPQGHDDAEDEIHALDYSGGDAVGEVWQRREETPAEEQRQDFAASCPDMEAEARPPYKDVPGPCDPDDLLDGVIFGAKYLGSTQLQSDKNPSTSARMAQAQEAVDRIKAPEGESQPMTEVDLFISTQRIKVLNADTQEAMMDHSLQMISYIADIGNIVVLMARRKPAGRKGSDGGAQAANPSAPPKKCWMLCHVFTSEDAQIIAQAIGQAFAVAYQQFLQINGIKPDEYDDFLSTQEQYNGDLVHFSCSENIREVCVRKAIGEILGLAVVESGWGSILPTVVVANLLHGGPAERCGELSIGDRIMSVNGTSLVGLPIATCHTIIRDLKNQSKVTLSIVHCPPVTMAIIRRPDPKYQLGFSVEDGIICSLMRGGIAERGGIRVGHRIIEINGQSVVATPHDKIIHILTNAVGEIHLKTMPASTYRLLTGQEQPLFL
ncbi:hypothetical protein ACEWY4_014992 [Coilia grayii]|uniref:Amyloid-beta A4 precursor protein-binding family A member 3 n=1 Tax=Coilia grayii TaxID=363190 RepID=A0ABD1JTY3_9TELE